MLNRYLQADDNEDLACERRYCEFNTDDLAAQIYGSQRVVQNRKRIHKFVEENADLRATSHNFSFLERLQTLEQCFRNAVAAEKHVDEAIDRDDFDQVVLLIDGDEGHPFLISHFLVLPMLENNADEEQEKTFVQPVKRHVWPTAYLQTELKHGTNINNLETTATYDVTTQEFVLHSPTKTSFKWWSGNLAVAAQMGVVMAQLWTNGQCYGMHPFFVQLRDFETHKPMPGVTIGDIGENMGVVAHDIGYISFNHYRVPRKSLLMRYYKVHPNGQYEPPLHPKLAHTGMIFARARMIEDISHNLAAAATIAIRYSCVRRQGRLGSSKKEVKIIEYQTQQYRILPQLARAFVFSITGLKIRRYYFKVMEDVKKGDTSLMNDLHAVTAGLKAVVSYQSYSGAEQCRLACGGHGYTLAARIPQFCTRIAAGCTYEGDNIVMLLQSARYLMKQAKMMQSGQKPNKTTAITSYLFLKSPKHSALQINGQNYAQQWTHLQIIFQHISRRLIMKAYNKLRESKAQSNHREIAWNKNAIDLAKVAKAHIRTFIVQNFLTTIQNESKQEVKKVMGDIFQLYLHYELQDCRADAMEDGFVSGEQIRQSATELKRSLAIVRKNCVNISDSFDMSDRYLCSVLGRRDGHVYENLWQWSQENPLNQHSVQPSHHKTLGQLLNRNPHSKI